MKKLLLLSIALLVFIAFCFTACDRFIKPDDDQTNSDDTNKPSDEEAPDTPDNPDDDDEEILYSQGLRFTSNKDGTCYVSGIGLCTDKEIIIPPVSPDNDAVTGIGKEAFKDSGNVVSIVLPDCLLSIEESAFLNCKFLESITLSASVTQVSVEAFEGCSGLKSIEVNKANSVYKSVDGCLFTSDGVTLVKYVPAKIDDSYTIPLGVKNIGSKAFDAAYRLTDIVIPDSVTDIGDYAFNNCIGFTSFSIPDSVESIGEGAFYGCSFLNNFEIGKGITNIGEKAFHNTKLYNTTSNWESNLLYIGNYLVNAKASQSGEHIIKEGTRVLADKLFYQPTSISQVYYGKSLSEHLH